MRKYTFFTLNYACYCGMKIIQKKELHFEYHLQLNCQRVLLTAMSIMASKNII